jgi:hypothetical protein
MAGTSKMRDQSGGEEEGRDDLDTEPEGACASIDGVELHLVSFIHQCQVVSEAHSAYIDHFVRI